jgi:ribosomal protein L11 methyltransferase
MVELARPLSTFLQKNKSQYNVDTVHIGAPTKMPKKRSTTLIGKVFTDPAFREKLLKNPGAIIAEYGLARAEQVLLKVAQSDENETVGEAQLIYKLMPNRVSDRFMVLPTSTTDTVEDDLIPIYLDQWHSGASVGEDGLPGDRGRAFGSGLHPSTYLCLDALEHHLAAAPKVLDIGTGTGILAIAAAKLGAGHVLAIDIDESAVRVALSNVKINEVDTMIAVEHASIQEIKPSNFDLVLANLTRSVHLELLQDGMMDLLAKDGKLIQSGIEENEQDKVLAALDSTGGVVIDQYTDRGWISFVVRRMH